MLNSTLRRLVNLPKTITNLTKHLYRVISSLFQLVYRSYKISTKVGNPGIPHKRRFRLLEVFKKLIYIIFFFPLILVMQLVQNTQIGKFVFSPVLPKLGKFYQHEPKEIATRVIHNNQPQVFPKLGIVTPSFNQGAFIDKTVDSVLSQAYPNLEYIVQDGESSDNTVEILSNYKHKSLAWESKPDNGQTHALNKGFKKIIDAEIMAYLNSDDILLQGAIEKVIHCFNTNPDVDVVYGNRIMIDSNNKGVGEWVLHGHDSEVLSYADYIPQETMFWRKSIWNESGASFDENFKFAMDWDLITRFRNSGAKFLHMPEFLGAFRVHESQKTSAMINDIGELEMNRIRIRELGYEPSQAECYYQVLPFLMKHALADFKQRYLTRKISKQYVEGVS